MSKTTLQRFGAFLAVLCLYGPAAAASQDVVARFKEAVLLTHATNGAETAAPGRIYDWLWPRVLQDYVVSRGLQALPEEVEAVRQYDAQFASQDRAQRARKAAELEQRLADPALPAEERAWLTEFLTVLQRLEASEGAEQDPNPEEVVAADERRAALVEHWKSSASLYREFGGVVSLLPFGPYPHGARVGLLLNLEERGDLYLAPEVRTAFFAGLAAPPAQVVAPERVDFTPYWQRPIPASYFAD